MGFAFVLSAVPFALAGPDAQLSLCSAPVSTTNGCIIGHQAQKRSHVCEYLGVPYAVPPIGHLRFAPPEAFTSDETLIASAYVNCIQPSSRQVIYPEATPQELQILANFANQAKNHSQSEDCLALNIWTKPSNRTGKPTLVFFHGGRWTGGTSNTPYYDGQFFADTEDVIVITLNFRINIFGFPGAPGATQNVGLLDQRRAVEWIRDNTVAFGGTPDKITIVGQSSGGVAVDFWSYSFRTDPIVSGLISHSGNAFSFPVNNQSLSSSYWYNVSTHVGCGNTGDVLPCMRSLNTSTLLAASSLARAPPQPSIARSIPAFQPTIDNLTVFADYPSLSSAGAFAPIPYLHGNNHHESGYYRISAYASNNATAPESVWTAFELESFTCPTARAARHRARAAVPNWRYRYFADWDNLRLYPGSGAYHGAEMNMVIGNSEGVSRVSASEDEERLSRVMMRAWAAFAGDPVMGLEREMGWPKYDEQGETLGMLGFGDEGGLDFVGSGTYDGECGSLGDGVI
ncbi:putative cholinesterase [Polyplosphaeria fusca]|uniref:Carboxylic ester hydrolase n=1 Tax=Polyplosphaeria fusca TaxID=682080 RepID=A0A9P4V7V6_9PLEO|nr:putative cholinesterase [Polyplosphaeria fusca]